MELPDGVVCVDELGDAALDVAVQLRHQALPLALGTVLATNLKNYSLQIFYLV